MQIITFLFSHWLLAIGYWLVYDDPSSSRLGIANEFALLSLRSIG